MNHNTIPASDDQDDWVQYYQPAPNEGLDSTASGSGNLDDQKSPTSKPIRRRSRASRKTPTTLLSANANNFRDLVQQFTGCPTAAISFANRRGPVNLNFGLKNATPIFDEPFQAHSRPPQTNLQHHQHVQQSYYHNNSNMVPHQYPNTDAFTSSNATTMDISNRFVQQDDLSVNDFATSDCFWRT